MDAALEEAYCGSDVGSFVHRPDAERLFERVVSSLSNYSVIVGSHGTGKSTLAKEVARKKAGVIYVTVPPGTSSTEVEDRLTSALREALNWRERVAPWRMMLQPGKRVLIFVFIVPRTNQLLPSRLTGERISQDNERFRAGCRPLRGQAWHLRRPHY